MADKLSTSALAKKRQQDAKQLFQDLKTMPVISIAMMSSGY